MKKWTKMGRYITRETKRVRGGGEDSTYYFAFHVLILVRAGPGAGAGVEVISRSPRLLYTG